MNRDIRLSDAEQRLLEHLRRYPIDAEVAVHMGIPVRDVKDRTDRLAQKVGVTTRAELVAWELPETAVATTVGVDSESTSAGEESTDSSSGVQTGRRISRRAVIGFASLATVTGLSAGVLAWSKRGDSKGSKRRRFEPLFNNDQVIYLGKPDSDDWQVATLNTGDPIAWPSGMFFLDPDGTLTGYRVAQHNEDFEPRQYLVSPGSRQIVAVGESLAYVLWLSDRIDGNRTIGNTIVSLQGSVIRAVADASILIASTGSTPVSYEDTKNLSLHLVTPFEPASSKTGAIPGYSINDLRTPWISAAAVAYIPVLNRDGGQLEFWTVTPRGERETVFAFPLEPGDEPLVEWTPDGVCYVTLTNGQLPPESVILEVKDGRLSIIERVQGRNADLSRDGRFIAYTEHEAGSVYGQTLVEPSLGALRNVVVKLRGGEPILRVRSADLGFGDSLQGSRWLHDSAGLIVQVGVDPLLGDTGRGYAILRLDGTLEPFSLYDTGRRGMWYDAAHIRGPVPAPWDGGLFALGHGESLHTGKDIGVQLHLGSGGPGHADPWGDGSMRVLRVSYPHGGHDGGGLAVLSLPAVEQHPFPRTQRFRVTGTGDCLNLRAAPSLDADLLGCYPDGSLFELDALTLPGATAFPPMDLAYGTLVDGRPWLAVRSEDGNIGWASGLYLQWTG